MARKYVNPRRAAIPRGLEAEVGSKFSIAPGGVTWDHVEAYLRMQPRAARTRLIAAARGPAPRAGDGDDECQTCGGSGRLKHPRTGKPSVKCPECDGTGEAPDDDGDESLAPGPGAALDRYRWARSWSAYLKAAGSDQAARAVIANAMGERHPAAGGFLVSEALYEQVFAYVEQSLVQPRACVIPMTTLRLNLPVIDNPAESSGSVLGGMSFAITEESAGITATTPAFRRVTLEARKLAGLLEDVPNGLVDDGGAAFDSFMNRTVGLGLAWALDDLYLNGTGVSEPEGLISAPCAITVTRGVSDTVSLTDVAAMWTRLAAPSMQDESAIWLASSKVVEQLATLDQTVDGTPIPASPFMLGAGSDGGYRLAGLPLVVTSHLPDLGVTGDLCLADFGWYAVGVRRELLIERSQMGETFGADTSDFRVTTRIDGRWLVREAITPSDGSQTTSPVVILGAAA